LDEITNLEGEEKTFLFSTENDPEIINNGILVIGPDGVWFETEYDMYTRYGDTTAFMNDDKVILPLTEYEINMIQKIFNEEIT
jgi:hypothetical protein